MSYGMLNQMKQNKYLCKEAPLLPLISPKSATIHGKPSSDGWNKEGSKDIGSEPLDIGEYFQRI